MHSIRQTSVISTGCFLFCTRCYRSAYRLKPGSLKAIKLQENKTGLYSDCFAFNQNKYIFYFNVFYKFVKF